MQTRECCVCGRPVAPDAELVRGRCFCPKHRVSLGQNRRALWTATGVALLGLLLFALTVHWVVGRMQPQLSGGALVFAGAVCALVPALLWLVIFYVQDHAEPEPKRYVLGTFLAGGALALLVSTPLLGDVFQLQNWLPSASWPVQLLGYVLIGGFVQEYCKYAAVRYTVYRSPEYDERVDGIVYGAAAGLGFAAVLNMQYVLGNNGVRLDMGVVRITVTALAHASFAGVMGYFLGRAKFERMGKAWLPGGLCLAAVLNGVVTFVLSLVSHRGLDYVPLNRLAVAGALALLVFAVLLYLIARLNAQDRAAERRGA